VHAESRFGGIPDWVVMRGPRRRNDPTYLAAVERYWAAMSSEVRGLFWKDGGPIIGVQLENEYNAVGEGRGRDHITTLKALAIRLGFDAPYYTVTGWDRTVWPPFEAIPVYGGYPDEPWSAKTGKLAPKETYLFRFDSRVSGDLGVQTQSRGRGDAEADAPHTPFLGAEYGGGVPTMYRRRPWIRADDIGAMLPVQIGSGVNLYGYYMYHGGSNPADMGPLREATAIGGYNDDPFIEYDFQAPFGQYGQAAPVLSKIRPVHYFLQSFGDRLAPMSVRAPSTLPTATDDLRTARFSMRNSGTSGFLFVNNYVRQYDMAVQSDVRFEVALPGKTVLFPERPIDIPSGAYFIWPIGFGMGRGLTVEWATVQSVTSLAGFQGRGSTWVFSARDGIPAQMMLSTSAQVRGGRGIKVSARPGGTLISIAKPGTGASFSVQDGAGVPHHVLILSQGDVERLSVVDLSGSRRLVLSDDELAPKVGGLDFISRTDAAFEASIFPADGLSIATPWRKSADGVFTKYAARVQPVSIAVGVKETRTAGQAPRLTIGGRANTVMEPYPEAFDAAGAWSVSFDRAALGNLEDVHLVVDWVGDVGRAFLGDWLIDDRYYDGRPWVIGLKRFSRSLADGAPLELAVLPLRGDSPVYIDEALRPKLGNDEQAAQVNSVRAVPQYRMSFVE
jgi:beta-galactosidase